MMIDELLVDSAHTYTHAHIYIDTRVGTCMWALQTLCYQSMLSLLFNGLINTLLTQFDVASIDDK